jgi:hypothetical protein
MPRLSRDVRLLILEIVLPLLLLGLAEVGFRAIISHLPNAPLPTLLPYPVASGKYLSYRNLADRDEPLDVLLMGMSQMLRANMGIVRQTIARETGRQILGFNFAAPLQSVEFNRRLLEDVLVPIKPPRVLVHGILPKNMLFEERPDQVDRMTQSLPVFAMHSGTPAARFQDLLFGFSQLLEYREVIRDTLARTRPPQIEFWVKLGRRSDQYGDVALNVPVVPVPALNVWEKQFIERFSKFDDLMQRTQLFDHLADLARTCRAHGIQLVLLNNAIHPLALQELPHGADDYARFVAALQATADALGVPFLNPAPGGIGEPNLFQDTVHHNVAGTKWLSERIAHFLLERGLIDQPSPHGATPTAGA